MEKSAKLFCETYLGDNQEFPKDETVFTISVIKTYGNDALSCRSSSHALLYLDEDDLKYLYNKYSDIARNEIGDEIKSLKKQSEKLNTKF